jgi:hypothetical protein
MEAHIPQGRTPFLPFGARSGWELLTRLEPFGCSVRGYDLIREEDLIAQCLAFMETPRYRNQRGTGKA